MGSLVGEYDQAGNIIQELVWLNDIPVATIRTDQSGGSVGVFYIHTDHLNAPAKITRPSDNAIIWRWDHDPYGNGQPNQDPDGNGLQLVFNLRYPGQYYDAETGLNYNYRRDYDPATGRYLESDPIGLHGRSFSTYAYVNGNPLKYIDPRGLYSCTYSISAHSMNCVPDFLADPSFSSNSYVAGNNNGACQNCQNNPDRTNVQNHGPVPVGSYVIGNITRLGGSRRRLTPDQGGRTDIELHGCGNPASCSTGCIGATTNAVRDELNNDLDLEPINTLTVIP